MSDEVEWVGYGWSLLTCVVMTPLLPNPRILLDCKKVPYYRSTRDLRSSKREGSTRVHTKRHMTDLWRYPGRRGDGSETHVRDWTKRMGHIETPKTWNVWTVDTKIKLWHWSLYPSCPSSLLPDPPTRSVLVGRTVPQGRRSKIISEKRRVLVITPLQEIM